MISFDTHNIIMPDLDFKKIEIWLGEISSKFNKIIGNINYIFCDDSEILKVNTQFLNHSYFTDIITFDYSHKDKVSGDIFISVETVKSNAQNIGEKFSNELLRVISHGLLHLCGLKDKSPEERKIMEDRENMALALWTQLSQ